MIPSSYRICFVVAVLAAASIWFSRLAYGQAPPQPAAQVAERRAASTTDDEFLLRTYDIGDLVLNVPDYPYPGGSGSSAGQPVGTGLGGGGFGGGGVGGGGGFFSVADDDNRSTQNTDITLDVLIDAITSTVATDSWAENGGGEADIRPVGNSLVVWQTVSAHERIADLLHQLRSVLNDRPTITIDARWLLLDSDDLDRLTAADAEGLATLDRKQLASLTRRPSTIRGLTNCFSGQLIYVVSGTRRNFITGYIPVVGSLNTPRGDTQFATLQGGARMRFISNETPLGSGKEKGVGYQPIVERSTRGALLEIRATVSRDTNIQSAIVDLRSTLTVPGGQSLVVRDQSETAPAPPVVDRIAVDTQEFATTLRVPLGKPVLVGGLTYVPPAIGTVDAADSDQSQEAARENPQYYLVLELR